MGLGGWKEVGGGWKEVGGGGGCGGLQLIAWGGTKDEGGYPGKKLLRGEEVGNSPALGAERGWGGVGSIKGVRYFVGEKGGGGGREGELLGLGLAKWANVGWGDGEGEELCSAYIFFVFFGFASQRIGERRRESERECVSWGCAPHVTARGAKKKEEGF